MSADTLIGSQQPAGESPAPAVGRQLTALPAAIAHLCDLVHVPFDSARRLAVSSALDAPGLATPQEAAIRALGAVDLRAVEVEIASGSLRDLLAFDMPLLARLGGASPAWLVIDPRQSPPMASLHGARSAQRPLRAAADMAMLLEGEQDVVWLSVEPPLALDSLRLPPGDERPKRIKTLARLRALIALEREAVGALVVYAIVVGLLMLATPLAVQALVNTIAFGSLLQPLIILTLILFSGIALAGVLRVVENVVMEYLQRRLFVNAMSDLAGRLPRVDAAFHAQRHTPELVNRFFDVMTIQKAASGLMLDGLELALQTVIGLIILAFYHPLLLAFDVLLLAALVFILFVLGRGGIDTSIYESNAKYAAVAWLEDIARHPLDFKSREGAQMAAERANTLARGWTEARAKHYKIVLRQIIGVVTLQAIASALLLGLGGGLVLKGQLTLGQLVAAELIVTLIVASVAKFGKHFESFYDLAAGISKLGELVDMSLEEVVGEHPQAVQGAARATLEGVRYEVDGRVVFDSLSLDIAPGTCLAITGGAGSGKSILLDMLFGLRRPTRGQVRVDGLDLRLAALPALRDEVVLLRDPALIDGTVEENMRLGSPLMTREQMLSALEIVGLRRRCEGMEGGLGAMLSASGAPLSSGQVVRLMLARAIAQRPRLLLIDGLLDQLSDEERTAVLGALFEGRERWTMVIISQSHEILRRCERVVRFKDGALVEVKR